MPRFAEAFRQQAESDLLAYEALVATQLPVSHRLHYLQMWLEKLCKAYLWLPDANEEELRTRHQVVAAVLPRLIAQRWRRLDAFTQRPDIESLRSICREVDLLHPQVHDGGRRPDNVEYPWTSNGQNFIPSEHRFPLARRLYTPPGPLLLKAAVQLTRDPALLQP
jgi:hypothetical protein